MTGTQLISVLLVIGGGLIWWLKSGSRAEYRPERRLAFSSLPMPAFP